MLKFESAPQEKAAEQEAPKQEARVEDVQKKTGGSPELIKEMEIDVLEKVSIIHNIWDRLFPNLFKVDHDLRISKKHSVIEAMVYHQNSFFGGFQENYNQGAFEKITEGIKILLDYVDEEMRVLRGIIAYWKTRMTGMYNEEGHQAEPLYSRIPDYIDRSIVRGNVQFLMLDLEEQRDTLSRELFDLMKTLRDIEKKSPDTSSFDQSNTKESDAEEPEARAA